MAAKKKPTYQDPSIKNRATTKDKPKSSSPSAAQIAALKGPTSTRKPTEAITAPGQKATGLAKSTVKGNRFSSTAKTKVNTGVFAGSGNPKGKQFNLTKGNIVNAALTVTALPGSGQVTKWAAGKIAGKVGGATANATWNSAAKGLGSISSGGKVSRGFGPMGPTLKSTRIMNPAQKSSALNALETRAANITNAAAKASATAASNITKKVIRNTVGGAKIAGATGAVGKNLYNRKKKK